MKYLRWLPEDISKSSDDPMVVRFNISNNYKLINSSIEVKQIRVELVLYYIITGVKKET